ncbi:MAG: hypothetical protein NTAFB01_32620 [Nitrospira sp.]
MPVLPPEDERFNRHAERIVRETINAYGRIGHRGSDGRVESTGTATFLNLGDKKFIVTASHVVDHLMDKSGEAHLYTFNGADLPRNIENRLSAAREFLIPLNQTTVRNLGRDLDVAIISAPSDVSQAPGLRWFNGQEHLQAINVLQEDCHSSEAEFVTLILGFPRFSREERGDIHAQVASNFQCVAYLRQIIDSGNSSIAPQLILELDTPNNDNLPDDVPDLARTFVANIQKFANQGEEPIGGYSGAPVIHPAVEGPVLLGFVKEASLRLGARVMATPLHVVLRHLADRG